MKQNAAYPVTLPADGNYTSPFNNCKYDYSEGIPHESACTLAQELPSLEPVPWKDYMFEEEKVCEDDPVKRYDYHNYPSIPQSVEELYAAWVDGLKAL